MSGASPFQALSPTTLAECLGRAAIMDIGIRPLWHDVPRMAGPAYPVRCAPGDSLMLHAAIYRAPPGSVIVAEAADMDYALAGGNVCAIAKRHGIAGFVIDGAIRDLGEVRAIRFPVFARGVIPIPGMRRTGGVLNGPVRCGGVHVAPGDIVVADEDGIVVVPKTRADAVLADARARVAKDAALTPDEWEKAHRARIDETLRHLGFPD